MKYVIIVSLKHCRLALGADVTLQRGLGSPHSQALRRNFCSFKRPSVQLAEGRYIKVASVMKRSRAKSRDNVMALMRVTYIGEDALPLQQDTEM